MATSFPLYEFTTLLMCSDPWPVENVGHGDGRDALVALADREARERGFTDWIDAYHSLHAPDPPSGWDEAEAALARLEAKAAAIAKATQA